MSNKNRKVVTIEVENQEPNVTPEIPVEGNKTTDGKEVGDEGEKTDKKKEKFHLPKIKLPRVPIPSKKTVIEVLKSIALLLLGAITGAVAIVAAAIRINSTHEDEEPAEEEIAMDESVEEAELASNLPDEDTIDNIE